MAKPVKDPLTGAETTGHVWDDDLQEFDNPLPRWWVWTFYATVIFTVVYWVLYPSWPFASSFLRGIGTVTYQTDAGEEKTTHWNTRALLQRDMQTDTQAIKQKEYLARVAAAPFGQIAADPDMATFVRLYGNGVFGDNCAACHQSGGQGVPGLFPNLVDDDWLYGSQPEQISHTIVNGRNGYMPPYRETLEDDEIHQVASYVMSLSGLEADPEAVVKGEKIFQGHKGGCYQCHTASGGGMHALGAANLTDQIWTVANVPAAESTEAKLDSIKNVVTHGVQRQMPAFSSRLSAAEVKVLVAYLKQLSGE